MEEKERQRLGNLIDLQILDIEHIGELCEGLDDLFYFIWREFLQAIHDFLLNGGRGMFSQVFAFVRQCHGDHSTVCRNPGSLYETFLLQTVYDAGDRAGIDHNVFGDLRGGQRTIFIEGKEAGELRGTDLVLFVEFLVI